MFTIILLVTNTVESNHNLTNIHSGINGAEDQDSVPLRSISNHKMEPDYFNEVNLSDSIHIFTIYILEPHLTYHEACACTLYYDAKN